MATLRLGSHGPEVVRLQRLLHVTPADGVFGPVTAKAVRSFQQSHGLVADGVVGPATWSALDHGTAPHPKGTGGSGGAPNNGGSQAPDHAPGSSGDPTADARSSVTLQQIRAIFTKAPVKTLQGYLAFLNAAMTEASINAKLRKAAFLAQVAHESTEFTFMKELGGHDYFMRMYDISGHRPDVARSLGNTNVGDGARYPGRGPIQVTGKNNYRACGKALGLDLVHHPALLEIPKYAFRGSAWYWRSRGINQAADTGDFKRVTKLVNGGMTHYADRLMYYQRALRVL